MTLTGQAVTMLSMVLCGGAVGILYDTYRTFERRCHLTRWLVWICDFLFWISCIFLVFGTLLRINEGVVRLYIFFGIGIGAIVYFLMLRYPYLALLNRMITFGLWLYRLLVRTGYYLLVVPILFLYRVVKKSVLLLLTCLLVTGQWLLRPFHWVGRWVWNMVWSRIRKPLGRAKRYGTKRWQALTAWLKGKKM
ncbi:spore cortex biosynthesis protein YabQ [Aneurinibacillus uraniidurans]|uniref:spore cortex biosynthesis protein YabQ n=1 Tax=Aneurinibacillus uraniidurans TaxID=2966586 RepID=UPI00234AA88C|nr:spore cortex biosynthesis protein YabQ [Aneurinibacillus sp. B1]WCN37781.1 spore cortex biosynthesis protein YabQ [Aneurinibacillus sp. B1]